MTTLSLLSVHEIVELLDGIFGHRTDEDTIRRWTPLVILSALAGSTWVAQQLLLSSYLSPRDPAIQQLVENRADAFRGINLTTRDHMKRALIEASQAGGSGEELQQVVRETFGAMAEHRAPLIALQEAGGAWEAGGTREMVLQVIPARMWITQRDLRVRVLHVVLDGQCRKPDEAFQTPSGHGAMYPRDPEAETEMTINCLLPGTEVRGHFVAGVRSEYVGPAREIITHGGRRLRVTLNHPILTPQGFVPAGSLCPGDDLVRYGGVVDGNMVNMGGNDEHEPALVEDVFDTLVADGTSRLADVGRLDLHGDARFVVGQVDVVRADRFLGSKLPTTGPQLSQNFGFVPAGPGAVEFGPTSFFAEFTPVHTSAGGLPSFGALSPDEGGVVLYHRPFEVLSIGTSPRVDAALNELSGHIGATQSHFLGELVDGHSADVLSDLFVGQRQAATEWPDGDTPVSQAADHNLRTDPSVLRQPLGGGTSQITLDQVVEIRDFDWAGQVYDLQTDTGVLLASNIACSNCRCFTAPLARGCESKSLYLATEAQRRAYWKAANARMRAEEIRFAMAVRGTLASQRNAVLDALAHRLR